MIFLKKNFYLRAITVLLTVLSVQAVVFSQEKPEIFERIFTEYSSVQTAISLNTEILIQEKKIEFAKSKLAEMRAYFFPYISLNLSYLSVNNYSETVAFDEDNKVVAYIPAGEYVSGYYSTRVSIWQNIYSGGKVILASKLAKQKLKLTQENLKNIQAKVTASVKTAFNEALYRRELLKFYETKLKLEKNPQKIMQLKKKIMREEFNFEKSLVNLKSTIGVELNVKINISGNFLPKIKNLSLGKCIMLSYRFRSELQVSQIGESVDNLSSNLTFLTKRLPSLSVGASQEWFGNSLISNSNNWHAFISASIPIFDGGANFEKYEQEKIKTRETTLQNVKVKDEITAMVNRSFLEYDFWKKMAFDEGITQKNSAFNDEELEIICNLNKNYFELEFAVGVDLDSY
jgi:hypothetical protein